MISSVLKRLSSIFRKIQVPIDADEALISLRILRSNVVSFFGLLMVIAFLVTTFAVWITKGAFLPYNPFSISTGQVLQPPSLAHLFGTDSLGRDVFSRVLAALPIDFEVPFAVLSIGFILGLIVGTVAGYKGGLVEEVMMRVTDVFLAFPGIVLALALAAAIGPGPTNSILALVPIWWPAYARLARGETLSIKSQQFVEASRAMGHKSRQIILHHIVPNVLPIMLVFATLDFGSVLLTFSILSFIGVGAQPPTPEWGLMSVQEEQYLTIAPWAPIFPALAILAVAIGFSLLGDGLRDALDPKIRGLYR